jgi:acyl carrier protein
MNEFYGLREAGAIIGQIARMSFREPEEIGENSPLFSSGIVDSVSLLELVVFLEKRHGIKIGPGDLSLENFDTVSRICALIARKLP